jgi:hypothetical protein
LDCQSFSSLGASLSLFFFVAVDPSSFRIIAFHSLDDTLSQSNAFVKSLLIQTTFSPPKEFIPTHRHPARVSREAAAVNTTGLNYLKIIGRTDTVTNYVNNRQQLGAFSTTFNSSRYEVSLSTLSVSSLTLAVCLALFVSLCLS